MTSLEMANFHKSFQTNRIKKESIHFKKWKYFLVKHTPIMFILCRIIYTFFFFLHCRISNNYTFALIYSSSFITYNFHVLIVLLNKFENLFCDAWCLLKFKTQMNLGSSTSGVQYCTLKSYFNCRCIRFAIKSYFINWKIFITVYRWEIL